MTARRPKDLRELADELAKRLEEPGKPSRGQSQIAHLTPGELVIPATLLTPEVTALLRVEAQKRGIDPARLLVGSGRNSINPRTGQAEFFDASEDPTEEITITAPSETGLVQLPQNLPNEFRTYGTPTDGQGQYGVPAAMGVIGAASHAWTAAGNAPFNVGNISLAGGGAFPPHIGSGHMNGTGIDIRPVRTDGKNLPTNYNDPNYDREATQRLVDTLRATGGVQAVYFNDPAIKGVSADRPNQGLASQIHNNHIHVQVDPNWRRPPGR